MTDLMESIEMGICPYCRERICSKLSCRIRSLWYCVFATIEILVLVILILVCLVIVSPLILIALTQND